MEIRIEELQDGKFMVEDIYHGTKEKYCDDLEDVITYIREIFAIPTRGISPKLMKKVQ